MESVISLRDVTKRFGSMRYSRTTGLVKFAAKEEMVTSDHPIIRQFLAGRAKGPIDMDAMSIEQSDIEIELMAREEARIAAQGITNADEIMTV